jgi:hypothetical protein
MREHRRAPRKDFLARVQVLWQSGTGQLQQRQGMTDDLSRFGIAIRMRGVAPMGNTVEIRLVNKTYIGIVRSCCRSGAEHLLGIEFCESAPSASLLQNPPEERSDVHPAPSSMEPFPETHQVEKTVPRWLRED